MTSPPPPGSAQLPPHLNPRGRRAATGSTPVTAPGAAPGRSRARKLLRGLAITLAVVIVAGSILGYGVLHYYDGRIDRIAVDIGLAGREPPPDPPTEARNYLLVGSDTRAGYTAQQLKDAHTTAEAGARSDSMMLMHVPADSSRVVLVSIPRDSWVRIPEWRAPTGRRYPAQMDKINAAFSIGDLPGGNPSLLKATVEDLTGMPIHHYVQIDFSGFSRMVDALGGVDVCLRSDAKDKYSGIDLEAGRHHVDGKVALAFVRQRYGVEGSDFGRIQRQQHFLGAVVREVTSADTLLNPVKLTSTLNVVSDSVDFDEQLDLRDLALQLRHLDPGAVKFQTLPFTDDNARREGKSVVLVDEAKKTAMFDEMRGMGGQDRAASPAPRLIVAPQNIRVRVLNAGGENGLAGRAAAELRQVGFVVTGIDSRVTGASRTVVRHGPDKADSARTLAAAIPGATTEVSSELGSTLEAHIGNDFTGASPVTVGPAPRTAAPSVAAPSPGGSVAAAPKPRTASDQDCAP